MRPEPSPFTFVQPSAPERPQRRPPDTSSGTLQLGSWTTLRLRALISSVGSQHDKENQTTLKPSDR